MKRLLLLLLLLPQAVFGQAAMRANNTTGAMIDPTGAKLPAFLESIGLGITDDVTHHGLTLGSDGPLILPFLMSIDAGYAGGIIGDMNQLSGAFGTATFGLGKSDGSVYLDITNARLSSEWTVRADSALGTTGYAYAKLDMDSRQRFGVLARLVARSAAHGDDHDALTYGLNFHPTTQQPVVSPGSAVLGQFEHEFDSGAGSGYAQPTHTLRPASLVTNVGEVYCSTTGTTVTGLNSKFLSDIRAGDAISIGGTYSGVTQGTYSGGQIRTVASVTDDDTLVVTAAFSPDLTSERCAVGSFALTGTVSVLAESTAVTGVGTAFTTQLGTGAFAAGSRPRIYIAGESHRVASVASDTALTLAYAHTAGASGVTYRTGGLLQNEWWLSMNGIRPFGSSGLAQYPEDQFTVINGSLDIAGDSRHTIQDLQSGHLVRITSERNYPLLIGVLNQSTGDGTTGTNLATGIDFQLTHGNPTYPSRIVMQQNNWNAALTDANRNSLDFYSYYGTAGAGSMLHLAGDTLRVGIGANPGGTVPAAKLHVLSTTEQLRLAYDAANYASFTISATGDLSIVPTGGDVSVTGNVTATNLNAFGTTAPGQVRIYEGTAGGGGGDNYTGFKAAALQVGDTLYEMPANFPAGNSLLQSTSAGVLSWSGLGTGVATALGIEVNTADGFAVTGQAGKFVTLDLDASTDATLARAGAGKLSVEGDEILTQTVAMTGITNKTFVAPVLGAATGTSLTVADGVYTAPSIAFAGSPTSGFYEIASGVIGIAVAAGTPVMAWAGNEVRITTGLPLGWSTPNSHSAADLLIGREGAAILQMGMDAGVSGTTAQTLKGPDRITSDGVGGSLTLAGGRNRGASAGGSLIFQTSPAAAVGVTGTLTTRLTIDENGISTFAIPPRLPAYTVATLPATAATGMVQGAHAIVTDATTPTYLGVLTGGGAVVCPVFYNGAAWVSH